MRSRQRIVVALAFALSGALVAFVPRHSGAPVAAQAKLDASIFSYDGHNFVRTQTTLMTQDGKSAVGTKLDHDSPAFKALMKKRSYTGEATLFGHKYDANYAPLTDEGGRLTGALFVAVEK